MLRYLSLLAVGAAVSLSAQTPTLDTNGGGFWHGLTRSYRPRAVPQTVFSDSQRIEKLIRAGNIYLSLRDAIALAIENNLAIENARVNPLLSQVNLQRASAGQLLRNVSNGINTGPSSASVGVLSGANALGAGSQLTASSSGSQSGVLSGINVQLAGSAIPNLDPVLFGFYQFSHTTNPQSTRFVTGTNFLVTRFQSGNFGIQKGFLTGTTATLGMNNTLGLWQNAPQNEFNPTTSAALSLQLTQNLLQGFGLSVNNRVIRVARNQVRSADLTFQQQVIATVANVVNLYQDLVTFNEQLRIRRAAFELNRTLYEDNRRRAELGALAEIDIIQTEAEMKAAQQEVITAEAQVEQQEMILKSVLTRVALDNLAVTSARIIPTDRITVPPTEPVVPLQDLVSEAVSSRPEVEQNRLGLENARISMLGTRNAMLPSLQAFANLANNAQAGQINTIPLTTTVDGVTTVVPRNPGTVNDFFLGGYGTVLSQLFRRNFPNYTVGLQLSIPLRNRAAQADYATDQLNYRQSQIQNHDFLNSLKLNVINAAIALRQTRAAYDTSVQARMLQDQTLAGQKRKYELGASTILDVLLVQRDAINRELAETQALNQYARARVNVDLVTGRILKTYAVDLDDARSGTVRREADLPVGPAPGVAAQSPAPRQ